MNAPMKFTNLDRNSWHEWLKSLQDLFSASFNSEVSSDYLEWRYYNNNQTDLLFCTGGEIGSASSSYSACPVELIQENSLISSMTSMTTMTRPSQQGKGWFPFLANELYARAGQCGIQLVWGFPNSRSHRTFIRDLGWTNIYEIPTLSLDLSLHIPVPSLATNVKRDDDFCLTYIPLSQDGLIKVRKSQEYLKWRYAAHPENEYCNYVIEDDGCVVSYIVTKIFEDGIDLVDIQVSSEPHLLTILGQVIFEAVKSDRRRISCWSPINHFSHLTLEKLGFQNSAPVTYFGGRTLGPGIQSSNWDDFTNWYIQMGDSDVY
jgi:hypothetical protein